MQVTEEIVCAALHEGTMGTASPPADGIVLARGRSEGSGNSLEKGSLAEYIRNREALRLRKGVRKKDRQLFEGKIWGRIWRKYFPQYFPHDASLLGPFFPCLHFTNQLLHDTSCRKSFKNLQRFGIAS